jgi:hypothetical protein
MEIAGFSIFVVAVLVLALIVVARASSRSPRATSIRGTVGRYTPHAEARPAPDRPMVDASAPS